MSGVGHQELVMNDRLLEINWVAGKPTPTIGSKRCNAGARHAPKPILDLTVSYRQR